MSATCSRHKAYIAYTQNTSTRTFIRFLRPSLLRDQVTSARSHRNTLSNSRRYSKGSLPFCQSTWRNELHTSSHCILARHDRMKHFSKRFGPRHISTWESFCSQGTCIWGAARSSLDGLVPKLSRLMRILVSRLSLGKTASNDSPHHRRWSIFRAETHPAWSPFFWSLRSFFAWVFLLGNMWNRTLWPWSSICWGLRRFWYYRCQSWPFVRKFLAGPGSA